MKTCFRAFMALLSLTLTLAVSAQASIIVYTESGTMTGSLGGTAFTNALVTFTLTGDTSGVNYNGQGPLEIYSYAGVTTVQIAGISGTATLTALDISAISFNFSGSRSLGIGDGSLNALLVNADSAATSTYDLASTYTSTGELGYTPNGVYTTTMGNLVTTGASGNATFTATLGGPAAVPEPSTYVLLCISLGVVGYARKKMVKREG